MTLRISSGSAISVDTASLRAAAARLDDVAERLRGASGEALSAATILGIAAVSLEARALEVQTAAARSSGRVSAHAGELRRAADAYELAELRFRWAIASGGIGAYSTDGFRRGPRQAQRREAELADIRHRWEELTRRDPAARVASDRLWRAWRSGTGAQAIDGWADAVDGIGLPVWTGLPLPEVGTELGEQAKAKIASLGLGVVPAFAHLSGRGDPVDVRPMALPAEVAAPKSLGEAADRIPDGETTARVRIETYEMPGGTREHVVYLAGTKGGGDDAWDWGSNLDLYNNRRSASFNGLEQALADAGVKKGEAVHELGFSQGAMVGARLATEGGYDVRSLIGFGSPVDVAGLDDVLQVSVRHTDDVVPSLTNGGNPVEGVVIEADYDPEGGVHDVLVPAHRLRAYAETASAIDASDDPRLGALHDLFDRLGEADGASAVEFSVERR